MKIGTKVRVISPEGRKGDDHFRSYVGHEGTVVKVDADPNHPIHVAVRSHRAGRMRFAADELRLVEA